MSEAHISPTLRRILLEAVILCTFAGAVGLSLNFQMVMNAFTGKTVAVPQQVKPASTPSVAEAPAEFEAFPDPVEMDEIDELLAEGALLIDARISIDYAKSHLAGAISLPLGEVEQQLDEFRAKVPQEKTLILYCNGFGCPDSFDLGVILLKHGYEEVRVFEGGYPQWRDAGRPLQGEEQ